MRSGAIALLLALGGVSLVLAQQRDEIAFRFEQGPHQLAKEVAKVDSLLGAGRIEDALGLAEKLERDPRIREGLVDRGRGRFVTLDRVLREFLATLDPEARRAYDARHAATV